MNYSIETNGNIIAQFEHKSDRDVCLTALAKVYTDCEFTAVDNITDTTDEEQTEEQTEEDNADTEAKARDDTYEDAR